MPFGGVARRNHNPGEAMKIQARDILTNDALPLQERHQIEIGEGIRRITISVGSDGTIRVSAADRRLIIEPRAANLVYVRSE